MPSFSRDSRPQLTLSSRAGGVKHLRHDNADTATTGYARNVYARQPITLQHGPASAPALALILARATGLTLALALALARTHGVRK